MCVHRGPLTSSEPGLSPEGGTGADETKARSGGPRSLAPGNPMPGLALQAPQEGMEVYVLFRF